MTPIHYCCQNDQTIIPSREPAGFVTTPFQFLADLIENAYATPLFVISHALIPFPIVFLLFLSICCLTVVRRSCLRVSEVLALCVVAGGGEEWEW